MPPAFLRRRRGGTRSLSDFLTMKQPLSETPQPADTEAETEPETKPEPAPDLPTQTDTATVLPDSALADDNSAISFSPPSSSAPITATIPEPFTPPPPSPLTKADTSSTSKIGDFEPDFGNQDEAEDEADALGTAIIDDSFFADELASASEFSLLPEVESELGLETDKPFFNPDDLTPLPSPNTPFFSAADLAPTSSGENGLNWPTPQVTESNFAGLETSVPSHSLSEPAVADLAETDDDFLSLSLAEPPDIEAFSAPDSLEPVVPDTNKQRVLEDEQLRKQFEDIYQAIDAEYENILHQNISVNPSLTDKLHALLSEAPFYCGQLRY